MADVEKGSKEAIGASMDIRGRVCSKPFMDIRRTISRLGPGDLVELLMDQKQVATVKRIFVRVHGHEMVVESHAEGGGARLVLRVDPAGKGK